jgi:hypothetical protein
MSFLKTFVVAAALLTGCLAISQQAAAQEIPPQNIIATGAPGNPDDLLIKDALAGKPTGTYSVCTTDACARVNWQQSGTFEWLGVNYFGGSGFVPGNPSSLGSGGKHVNGNGVSCGGPGGLVLGCGYV